MKLVFVVSFITLLLTFMVGVLSLSLGVMLGVSILVLSVHGLFFMFMKGLVFTFWVGVVVFLVVEGLLGIMIGVGLGYFKNFSGVIEFVIVGSAIYLLGWFFGLPKFMVMMLKEVWGSRGTFIFYKVWTLIISYKSFNSFRCMVSTGALSAFFNGPSEEECGSHLNLPNYKVFNEESKERVYCFSGGSEGSSYSGVSISSSPILKALFGGPSASGVVNKVSEKEGAEAPFDGSDIGVSNLLHVSSRRRHPAGCAQGSLWETNPVPPWVEGGSQGEFSSSWSLFGLVGWCWSWWS